MKTAYIMAIIFALATIGCILAYQSSPNYVAPDGMLVESFAWIPLAWICGSIAVAGAVIGTIIQYHKK